MYLAGPPGRHAKSFGLYNQKGAPHPKELYEDIEDSKPSMDLRSAQKRLVDQAPASVSTFIKEQSASGYIHEHVIG